MALKNRFNRLTSKEWLPFQKSWFKFITEAQLISDNFRFFSKAEVCEEAVFYSGEYLHQAKAIAVSNNLNLINEKIISKTSLQFAFIDLRKQIAECKDVSDYLNLRHRIIDLSLKIYEQLEHRRFICICIPNKQDQEIYYPYAWDLAMQIASVFSLKDEKIACMPDVSAKADHDVFKPGSEFFYCLYFRKDENSSGVFSERQHHFFERNKQIMKKGFFHGSIPSWFILKPTPRKKNEILHPAKYPEDLVSMFIHEFTQESANIFDPMSGTGSTQVAALKSGRNAYGTELSPFFTDIANQRCTDIIRPAQKELFSTEITQDFILINKDARTVNKNDFPDIDYLITSPPYWDMLNMKGAENQAKRIEKGLQTNYSESDEDLGNISDYESFLNDLADIYFNTMSLMKSGSYMTIVVKNIKKKGKNYPFAWDLADKLMDRLILLPEVFWCQDDINLAPYGYGNTFVSNTFHQYCLTFQVP